MQFVPNGPSTPDEVLVARDAGDVIFFCSAGVSQHEAGLPNFKRLGRKVIDILRNMKKNGDDVVHFELDPGNLPSLSEAQKAELAALEAMPDSDVDYSETPALFEVFWQNPQPGRFYKPIKQHAVSMPMLAETPGPILAFHSDRPRASHPRPLKGLRVLGHRLVHLDLKR